MKELIEALQIFLKYGNPDYPTHCEHDEMNVCIDPSIVTYEDTESLAALGFFANKSNDCFTSFKFGSA